MHKRLYIWGNRMRPPYCLPLDSQPCLLCVYLLFPALSRLQIYSGLCSQVASICLPGETESSVQTDGLSHAIPSTCIPVLTWSRCSQTLWRSNTELINKTLSVSLSHVPISCLSGHTVPPASPFLESPDLGNWPTCLNLAPSCPFRSLTLRKRR